MGEFIIDCPARAVYAAASAVSALGRKSHPQTSSKVTSILTSAKTNEIGESGVVTQRHSMFLSQFDGVSHHAAISFMKSATDVGRADQRCQSPVFGIEVNFEPSPPFLAIGSCCQLRHLFFGPELTDSPPTVEGVRPREVLCL